LEIGRFNPLASGLTENRQWRMFPIIAAVMRPVWQPVMIADQLAMKLDRLLNRFASLPVIFTVTVK
jgi:hypothetical protein